MFKNKKVLVYGLKKSGFSACKLLLNHNVDVYVYDDNIQITNDFCEKLKNKKLHKIEKFNLEENFDYVVLSPGIDNENEIVKHLKEKAIILSELELGFLFLKDTKLIAITGTNGKTTTTRIVGHILSLKNKNTYEVGNIGTPITEKVDEIKKGSFTVCEVSSFQLENIVNFRPKISCLLNISEDHLNRHKTLENYIKIKFNIFSNQTSRDYAIFNADDKILINKKLDIKPKIFFFSKYHEVYGTYIFNGDIYFKSYENKIKICSVKDINLLGEKNLENILCAICICCLLKVEPEIIKQGVKTFLPLKNRLEPVKKVNGKLYINDSKATNIDSCLCALNAFKEPIILLLGGSYKGYEFDELFKDLPENVISIIAYGQTKNKIFEAGKRNGYEKIIKLKENLEESVNYANSFKLNNSVVLLSPACASFDQFSSYEERGDKFKVYVNKLN